MPQLVSTLPFDTAKTSYFNFKFITFLKRRLRPHGETGKTP